MFDRYYLDSLGNAQINLMQMQKNTNKAGYMEKLTKYSEQHLNIKATLKASINLTLKLTVPLYAKFQYSTHLQHIFVNTYGKKHTSAHYFNI